jgi:transcriptional regulator with XRE-family HTH domain
MKPRDRFDALIKRFQNDPQFIAEGLLLDINEQLVRLMHEQGISQSALAQKLGVSNAYVSRLLNGNENLTIKQLVRIARVLGRKVEVAFIRDEFTVNRLPRGIVGQATGTLLHGKSPLPTASFVELIRAKAKRSTTKLSAKKKAGVRA